MSSLADLKGAIVRLDEVLEQAEALRFALSEEQAAGLTTLKRNADSMRNDLHELMMSKPDVPEDLFPPIGPTVQAIIDESVASLGATTNSIEAWLDDI